MPIEQHSTVSDFSDDDHHGSLDEADSFQVSHFACASRHQFFEGGDRGQLLDILPLLHVEDKNCVVIHGEHGFGKTSIAHQIFLQTRQQGHSCVMLHGSELASDDDAKILDQLLTQFKLPESPEIAHGQALAAALQSRKKSGPQEKLVLIIDDAHQMSPMAGIVIAELLGAMPRQSFQVVLLAVANPEILVAGTPLQNYLSVYGYGIELRPFNARETGEYVRFLLIGAEREDVKLGRQAMSRIFQMSGGVPAKINEGLVYALQEYDQNPPEDGQQRSDIVPKWHLVSLGLVAAGVVGLIVFGNPDSKPTERFSETVRSLPEQPASPPIRFTDAPVPQPLETLEADSDVSPTQAADFSPPVAPDLGQPQSDPVELPSEFVNRSQTPVPVEPAEMASSPTAKVSIDHKLARLRSERSSIAVLAADGSWIKNMPADHYTLQLLGGGNQEAIRAFVNAHGSYRKLGYFETNRNGQPWYVVVYGEFQSKDQAKRAASELPADLKPSEPWARRARDIQAAMR